MTMKANRTKNRREERGSELFELALLLPVLLVIAAGVIDFTNAWSVRQVLANAAREGSRLASAQPMLDLDTTNPETIQQTCQDVADYLAESGVSTAFMNGTSANPAAGCDSPTPILDTNSELNNAVPLAWTYYSSGTYGLKIQRTVLVNVVSSSQNRGVSSTVVTLNFPFRWPFGFDHIINLTRRGAGNGYPNPLSIKVHSTMANID